MSAHLDDGGDELHQEAGKAQQGGVEVVEEVHDQALDVGAIMVLISHDHKVSIPQRLDRVIALHHTISFVNFIQYIVGSAMLLGPTGASQQDTDTSSHCG